MPCFGASRIDLRVKVGLFLHTISNLLIFYSILKCRSSSAISSSSGELINLVNTFTVSLSILQTMSVCDRNFTSYPNPFKEYRQVRHMVCRNSLIKLARGKFPFGAGDMNSLLTVSPSTFRRPSFDEDMDNSNENTDYVFFRVDGQAFRENGQSAFIT
jgi:hypothetical protein